MLTIDRNSSSQAWHDKLSTLAIVPFLTTLTT
jgi:hypothetical protein